MNLSVHVNIGRIDDDGVSQDEWYQLDVSPDSSPITRDKIKDYSDVGLIFTPYSREFRVPASKNNNKAFKHWYNPKIYEGYDPRKKYEAMLKVNGFDYRKGYIKLNGVDLKKNQPLYYRIQFLGEMTSLRETLGNTELSDLTELDELQHPYNISTVKDGVEEGLSISGGVVTKDVDGDIKYPFISHSRGFEFDEQGFHRLLSDQEKTEVPAGLFEIGKKYKIFSVGSTDFTAIGSANNTVGTEFIATGTGDGTGLAEYIVTNPDKLSYTDLKPAIRVKKIIDAITNQFPSLVFDRSWMDSSPFNDLFLWMHSEKGSIKKQITNNSPSPQGPVWWGGLGNNDSSFWELDLSTGTEQRTSLGLRTLFQSSSSFQRYLDNTFTVTTPDSGSFSIRVKVVEKDIDGNTVDTVLEETAQGVSGSASITFTLDYYLNIFKYYYVFFYVYSDDGIANFTPTIVLNKDSDGSFGSDEVITYEGSAVSAVDSILPTQQMPKMKVFEFMQNIFRMFNLVAYENRNIDGSFEIMVKPLNDWLDEGQNRDVTEYVSIDESKVDRVNPFSNIRFGYPDPKTFLAINQRETTNDDWGDLEVNISEFNEGISQSRFLFDGGEYNIDLAFEKMMYERLPNQDTNGLTKLQYGWAVNDNEENIPEPVLTRPLLMFIENQSLDYGGDVYVETLDWDNGTSSEVYNRPSNVLYGTTNQTLHFNAEFDEYTAPEGASVEEGSLYATYYERFVAGVFSNRASRRHVTAYLPPQEFLNYKMNDKFVIDDVDYQIEEIETNHRNGKSKLALIRMTDENAVYTGSSPSCYSLDGYVDDGYWYCDT